MTQKRNCPEAGGGKQTPEKNLQSWAMENTCKKEKYVPSVWALLCHWTFWNILMWDDWQRLGMRWCFRNFGLLCSPRCLSLQALSKIFGQDVSLNQGKRPWRPQQIYCLMLALWKYSWCRFFPEVWGGVAVCSAWRAKRRSKRGWGEHVLPIWCF